MAEPIAFDIAKRRKEKIPFTLGDDPHVFDFDPPKSAVMMLPIFDRSGEDQSLAMTRSTFDWLGDGLSEEDNELIQNRLKDPEDDLDIPTLGIVIQKLSETVGGRPTT